MSRIAYVNGQYVPHNEASVHIEDRGYQFGDGVYEVCSILNGHPLETDPHLDRLDRSLREIRISEPMSRGALKIAMKEVIRRNRVKNGLIYIQVTRGVAKRDHPFPANVRPSVVMTARAFNFDQMIARGQSGVKVITLPDERWARCDIKSVGLLPNILAKQKAREAGAFEAWQVDRDGFVTEGSSTNTWIVTKNDVIVTRALTNDILPGITRLALLGIIKDLGLRYEERAFTVAEALDAREAFITSATAFATPVVEIDGRPVGNGAPGLTSQELIKAYWRRAVSETGVSKATLPALPLD